MKSINRFPQKYLILQIKVEVKESYCNFKTLIYVTVTEQNFDGNNAKDRAIADFYLLIL